MTQRAEAEDYNQQLGFINELFHLFEMIEIVFHGNGLILGASAEDILQENVFLESQLRGAVDETICYIPRFIENQERNMRLQRQFSLCYSILLKVIAAGAQEHIIQQELKQCFNQMCSAYLQGQILSIPSSGIFFTTELGNPVRQETVIG